MFSRIWQYDVAAGREADFERVYGADGEWSRLFSASDDFLGTELYRCVGTPGRYLTIDRFGSQRAWERFVDQNRHAYTQLDGQASELTMSERELAAVEA